MGKISRQLPTFGSQTAVITFRSCSTKCHRQAFSFNNHVFRIPTIPIESYSEFILKETQVYSKIQSLNLLPTDITVH